jgi:hypothetical protein
MSSASHRFAPLRGGLCHLQRKGGADDFVLAGALEYVVRTAFALQMTKSSAKRCGAEDFASIHVVDWTKSFASAERVQRRFDYVIRAAVQTAGTKSSAWTSSRRSSGEAGAPIRAQRGKVEKRMQMQRRRTSFRRCTIHPPSGEADDYVIRVALDYVDADRRSDIHNANALTDGCQSNNRTEKKKIF